MILYILSLVVVGWIVPTTGQDYALAEATVSLMRHSANDFKVRPIQLNALCQNLHDNLIATFWRNGMPSSVWELDDWLNYVKERDYYRVGGTNLSVGNMTWSIGLLKQFSYMVQENIINIHTTELIIVINGGENDPILDVKGIKQYLQYGLVVYILLSSSDSLVTVWKTNGIDNSNIATYAHWRPTTGLRIKPIAETKTNYGFNEKRMILSVLHKPRTFDVKMKNGSFINDLNKMGGYLSEVTRIMLSNLNATSDIVIAKSFGSLQKNGKWNGMVQHLVEQKADIAPLDFSPSYTRSRVVDYGYCFGEDPLILISNSPGIVPQPFLLLQVFQPWVWAVVLISVFCSGIAIYYIERTASKALQQPAGQSLRSVVATSANMLLGQNSPFMCITLSGRTIAGVTALIAIVISSLYRGSIISFLAFPRRSRAIDSAEDLMNKLDTVVPVGRKFTVNYGFLLNFPPYAPIANSLEFHVDSFITTWGFFSRIHDGKYVLIDVKSSASGRAAQFESISEECKFHISERSVKHNLDCMIYKKNSVYRPYIDSTLKNLRSFGIINKIRSLFFETACKVPKMKLDLRPFTLAQFQSAFYILFIGTTLASVIFMAEMGCSFRKHHNGHMK